MILHFLNPLVDLNKYLLVLDVSGCDQWLTESCYRSRLLIYLQEISDIKKVQLLSSHIKESHIKMSIILVRNEEFLASCFLFNQVDFQIDTSDHHGECALLLSEAVPLHLEMLIILLRNCDAVLRVQGDDHVHQRVVSFEIRFDCKVIKDV